MSEALILDMLATNFEFDFHDLANEYPLIEGDEFEALVEDIRKHGILEPIMLYQDKILDGRNRYRAAKACDYPFTTHDFKQLLLSIDPEEYVSSRNDHRRNLTAEQKRMLIERKINRHPNASDRKIAKLACCDNKTVASVRKKMQERVETFTQEWGKLSQQQRREFATSKREEVLAALGISSP